MFTSKGVISPHTAAAQGAEDFEAEDGDSQMSTGSEKPMRTDDAEKASQRHPLTGQYVSDQIPSGASHGPLAQALAMHRPAQPLADLATVPGHAGGALASSISSNQGAAVVQSLDYRTGSTPLPSFAPIQPAPHTAPNQPGARRD